MNKDRTPLPASTSRFDTIDVMRGYSIIAVVLLHTWLRLYLAGFDIRRPSVSVSPMLAHLFFANGGNGVTVFFAISGFLITLTSLRRFGSLAAMRPAVFYRIRFARIAPLLVFIVALLSLLALAHVEGFQFSQKRAPLWRAIIAVFTFHSNWLEARYGFLPANWNVMWSLSVEEMFYLFFPLACVALLRFRRGMVLFVLLLLSFVAMGPFARTIWSSNEIWQEQSYLGGMDGIALGCLTALMVRQIENHRMQFKLLTATGLLNAIQVVGWSVIVLIALGPKWLWMLLPTKPDCYGTLLAVSVCLVMFGSVLRQDGSKTKVSSRLTAPIRWYGRHSYEVYLTHEFIVVWGVLLFIHFNPNDTRGPSRLVLHQPGLVYMLCWVVGVLLLTAPLGWAAGRFIAEPLNRRLRGAIAPK